MSTMPANHRQILFVSPFFWPEAISTGKYNTCLVEALAAKGNTVDVVTSHPFYPAWKPLVSHSTLSGVRIHRAGGSVRYPKAILLRRLVLELWFACYSVWKTWKLRRGLEQVIVVFPPSLFAVLVNRIFPSSIHKLGIVHDFQATLGFTDGGLAKRAFSRIVHAIETIAFRSCHRIIVLSNAMAEQAVQDYGLDSENISVCYPFISVNITDHLQTRLADLFTENAQHVVYSGALGKKQNSFQLLEVFRAAAVRLPDVHFHLFSKGPVFDELRRLYLADPVGRIHFHDLVADRDLEELYLRSSVQIIPQEPCASSACLPSKLPNILAAGTVILAICAAGCELATLLAQTGTAIVADNWQMDLLVERLQEALLLDRLLTKKQRRAMTAGFLSRTFSLDLLIRTCDPVLGVSTENSLTAPLLEV